MRIIDADALIEFIDMGHLRNPLESCFSERDVVDMLESCPTIEQPMQKHGRWEFVDDYTGRCTNCHEENLMDWEFEDNFCPNCGAKMDGEND